MDEFRLGKREYQFDEKTLRLGNVISPTVVVPHHYDFDKYRHSFPLDPWGNQEWGNCVKVGEANQLIRLERIELRRTLSITTEIVVREYQEESAREFGTMPQSPGDSNDKGLFILQNLRNWRKVGFKVGKWSYVINAFGEIEPGDADQLRAAVYLLHGVQFGFSLPLATRQMTNDGLWDVPANVEGDPQWAAGSWGGHCVYCKAYDENTFEVITWGKKIKVTPRFIAKYADEAWAVVDSFDYWRKRPEIDVQSIIKHLHEIGASNIEA